MTKSEKKLFHKDDAQKAIDSLTEDEVKALCWKGEEE